MLNNRLVERYSNGIAGQVFIEEHLFLKPAAFRISCIRIPYMVFLQDNAFAIDDHVAEMRYMVISKSIDGFINTLYGP